MDDKSGDSSKGQSAADPAVVKKLKALENVLMELSKALRGVQFYPKGHPSLEATVNKAHSTIVEEIGDASELAISASKSGFSYEEHPIAPENTALQSLARDFHLRQIKKIFFLKDSSPSELVNFVGVIAMEPEVLRGPGKAEEYLQEKGVRHIYINEIKFGEQGALETKKKEEQAPEVDLDARVLSLLAGLDSHTDPEQYSNAVTEIKPFFTRFVEDDKLDEAFEITSQIGGHATDEAKPEELRAKASELLKDFPDQAFLEFLMRQLTLLDGEKKEKYVKVAINLEDVIVDACIEKLASNEALYSHRALIQLVLELKEVARPKLENALLDERWHVVRKMAFILGEMKAAESVPSMIAVVSHKDMRIKKEVLKALMKIRSTEAMKYLLSLPTSSEKDELRLFVVSQFGQLKERAAVPNLVKILKDRGRMLDNYEMLAESVRALGTIGSVQAVPVLEDVLLAKSFLAKASTQSLAMEAAGALSQISSKEALQALKKAEGHKNEDLKRAVALAIRTQEHALQEKDGRGKPQRGGDEPSG